MGGGGGGGLRDLSSGYEVMLPMEIVKSNLPQWRSKGWGGGDEGDRPGRHLYRDNNFELKNVILLHQ